MTLRPRPRSRESHQRKAVPRHRTRSKLGTLDYLDHGFIDSRSYVETRTGRVVLRGADYQNLRRKVYQRAGGRCEFIKSNGKRCNKFAPLDGIGHGELAHTIHRKRGGSDSPENASWSCGGHDGCHRKRDHPGPQWSPLIRRGAVDAGQDKAEPPAGMDGQL